MAKGKKEVKVEMHQHIDKTGKIFGHTHPKDARHYNEKTRAWHNWTLTGFAEHLEKMKMRVSTAWR